MNASSENFPNTIKPIIFWHGFPVCGLLIKKVVDEYKENIIIVATKTKGSFTEVESILGHSIIWLDDANDIWKHREEWSDRNFIVHTGWIYRNWLKYDQYLKKRNNAKVVIAVDNRYRGDVRQYIGVIWFRLYLKKFFDAALVPGKQGQKLMRFLGMNPSRIYTGLYGAYEGIFNETKPIETRNKEFLFVGQLNERKAIDVLIPSFKKYREAGGIWTLRIVGDGPLKDICHGDGIILENFINPYTVAEKMNTARVLVLPSRDDNWGTVICEAAACGMQIIGTQTAGATNDIIENGINGISLKKATSEGLEKAFFYFENISETALKEGSKISKERAKKYDSSAYYSAFSKIIADLS